MESKRPDFKIGDSVYYKNDFDRDGSTSIEYLPTYKIIKIETEPGGDNGQDTYTMYTIQNINDSTDVKKHWTGFIKTTDQSRINELINRNIERYKEYKKSKPVTSTFKSFGNFALNNMRTVIPGLGPKRDVTYGGKRTRRRRKTTKQKRPKRSSRRR